MSTVNTTEIKDRAGTGGPNFTNGVNFAGSDSGISPHSHTEGSTEPSSPSNGDTWWDSDNSIYKVYMNNEWKDWIGTTAPATIAWGGDRGFHIGGFDNGGSKNQIQYFNITTSGNAQDFGDTNTTYSREGSGLSSGSRIVLSVGNNNSGGSSAGRTNQLEYFASATTGNATNFGTLSALKQNAASSSNGTRGVFASGISSGGSSGVRNEIEYITIANTGNATDFGDLLEAGFARTGVGGATRGLFNSGRTWSNASYLKIEYITIATTGNATAFGETSQTCYYSASASDATRAIIAAGGGFGGTTGSSTMEYVTVDTTGNATDFGDLTNNPVAKSLSGCANATYATFSGGIETTGYTYQNIINRVTVQTTGNATDHGDLATATSDASAAAGNAS